MGKLETIYEKIDVKLQAECARMGDKIPYTAENGCYETDKGVQAPFWWTNGFWAGMLWQMFQSSGKEIYKETAKKSERLMEEDLAGFVGLHHDVGFQFLHTAVADYRLTGDQKARVMGLHAANLLAGRFNPMGNFIRAWNDGKGPRGEEDNKAGWMIKTFEPRVHDLVNQHAGSGLSRESEGMRMEQARTMRQVVEKKLRPIMESLFERVSEGGLELQMDGTPVYNERAQFVGGKVMNQACYTALEFLKSEESLNQLGDIIRMVSDMPMETWGILNGISGLYRLKKAGLLERVVDEETLEKLKKSMDWRTFVDIDNHYALIHKPTNYYGVAFGIARHRELLGWEPEGHSTHLLARLMEHIDRYSGALCFMDETPGEGRFDRYSVLVPSELASQLLATGWEVPEKIRKMLAKSAHIFLQLANEEGLGFAYGRSIGAYGDSAALEVLSAAARLGDILNGEEMEIAYGYNMKLLEHMVDFWYDEEMDSVNMWEKGRKTDNYRNKNRILGENVSLCMQMMNSFEHWEKAGYGDHEICGDYRKRLAELEPYMYIPFAEGEYERGLAIVRNGGNIWSLPLINGGQKYYDKDPYMPVPFQNLVLQGVPEYHHGQLIPQLWMESGEVLMPISYMKNIVPQMGEDSMTVSCRFDAMCRMGKGIFVTGSREKADSLVDNSIAGNSAEAERPGKVEGISDEVRYTFMGNQIKREDTFTIGGGQKVKKVRLVLLTYSKGAETEGTAVRFAEGILSGMQAKGYGDCCVWEASDDGSFDTPHGRLSCETVWERAVGPEEAKLDLSWMIEYNSR